MAPMISTIKMVIYSLVLLQLGFGLGVAFGWDDDDDDDVKQQLCNNPHLKLRNFRDFRRTETEGCAPEVERAFKDFAESVDMFPDSCNMEKVTNLTRFADTYLRNNANNEGTSLPDKFVTYAIAYGMELGSRCKKALTDEFYHAVKWVLTPSDFEAIDEWIGDDGPVARLLDPISKQSEFPLPSDFIDLLPEEFEDSYKSALKLTDSAKYNRAKQACEKRFRPLYANEILPVSHLVRNGFTYNTPEQVRDSLLSQKDRNRYKRWSRIVFLCEFLKDIQFVEGPDVCPPMIDVVPAGEADGQRTNSGRKRTTLEEHGIITRFYGPQLGSSFNLRLDNAIKNYKSSLIGTDRFKRRVLKNKGRLLLAAFKSKETMASLVKRAFDIVSRRIDGKQAEELEATKKNLLSLLDKDNKSKFVRVLTKLAKPSAWVLRKFAILVEFLLLIVWFIISIPKSCCCCCGGGGGDVGSGHDAFAGPTGIMLMCGVGCPS